MQPKTKFQKMVAGLKSKLKPVSQQQKSWGLKNCFEYLGTITKNKANCLECGHSWPESPKLIVTLVNYDCPNCGRSLKMQVTRKTKHNEVSYFSILTTVGEFQVIRMFYLTKYCKIGIAAQLGCYEVMQHWINGKAESLVFSRLVNGFSNYFDNWILTSDMEIRGTISHSSDLRNSIVPNKIYPRRSVIETLTRNGFKGHFYGISPIHLFNMLLVNSKAETLIKARQGSLLKHYYKQLPSERLFDRYWKSIKICMRNNYVVSDASIWFDYLDLLEYFNKDILNSYYVCPLNLGEAHDILVNKKRQILEHRRLLEDNRKAEFEKNAPIRYQQEKGKFFGLLFSDGEFTIKVDIPLMLTPYRAY